MPPVMDIKARELLEKYKHFALFWSGGLDSTGVLTALLKNGIDPKSLVIFITKDSVVEYPYLYFKLKKQGFRFEFFEFESLKDLSLDDFDCICSGMGGGSYWMHRLIPHVKCLYEPAVLGFGQHLIELGYHIDDINQNTEAFNQFLGQYRKVDLPFYANLWYLIYVNFKTRRSFFYLDHILHRKTQLFYDDDRFRAYVLHKVPVIHDEVGKPAKQDLRDYIFSVTHDDGYVQHKGYRSSWLPAISENTCTIWYETEESGFKTVDCENHDLTVCKRFEIQKEFQK